jgi:hypothetical protein
MRRAASTRLTGRRQKRDGSSPPAKNFRSVVDESLFLFYVAG